MNPITTPTHTQKAAALPPGGFVRLSAILTIIPIGKSLLWEMVARGDFPKPVKLSKRVTAWRSDDVIAFMASR